LTAERLAYGVTAVESEIIAEDGRLERLLMGYKRSQEMIA
jgi:hypothetical protein